MRKLVIVICPQCQTVNTEQSLSCSKCGSSLDMHFDAERTLDATPLVMNSANMAAAGATATSTATGSGSRTGARSSAAIYGVLEPGDELGHRYRIVQMLGQGGMGRVYKAYDGELDRTIAVKVLQPEFAADSNAMQRFKQELLLASRISHKNILRIHDLGEADGLKFISMAFVDGPDLHHLLQHTGKLPASRAVEIAIQLCEALDAAHSEGVIHRDLKPQNILMGPGDHVYISDFGLAKCLESSTAGMTRTGQYLGTPRYMAPEQVETGPVDKRTDIYALGLILFEMVTGESPFKGDSTLQVMYRRVKEKAPNPRQIDPEVPDYLAGIIVRCLEREPLRRYQDAKDILGDLRTAHAPTAKGMPIPLPDVGKAWWIGAAAALLLAILFTIPSFRRIFWRGHGSVTSSSAVAPPGVPPLSRGRFVAVLPVQVLGNEAQLGYVAQGIEEALSAKLFQLKDIRMTPTEAAASANPTESLPKIAGALGANLLVQSILQGSREKIRIVINLEDAADGKRIWSQEFNGVIADLFTLEDQIYNQLVTALNVTPSGDEMARAAERPTDNLAAYDVYLRGRNALRNSQNPNSVQAALDYFGSALKQDPKFALAYTGIADASLRMYHIKKDSFWTEKALNAAQQAEQLNNRLPEVHVALGNVFSSTGKYAEAISELKRALALAPNSESAYRLIGDAYMKSGNSAKAIAAYEKCIELDPYYWFNQNILGNAYFRLGDYPKALAAYNKVTQMEPDNATGYDMSGMVLAQEGKYQESIPAFQRAISISPDWTAYTNLGTAYFLLKQYQQAADMYAKAVRFDPNNEINMGNLADAYRLSGQTDKARTTYRKAISLAYEQLQTNPQDADVMDHLAQYYAKTGDGAQAQTFIHRARTLQPNSMDHLYTEAQIDAILGRKQQALKLLETALRRNYPAEYAAADPDMKNLEGDPTFENLVRQYAKKK